MDKKNSLKEQLSQVSEKNKTPQQKENEEKQPKDKTIKTPQPSDKEETIKAIEECAEWKERAMRMQAEMENLRKRTAIDMENHLKFACSKFAKDLLPVADCLANALECAKKEIIQTPDNTFLSNMITGLEMVQKQLSDALKKQGVEKIESLGKIFDPNLHQVISQIDVPNTEAGIIVQEMQTGYTIGGDRILREAMVVVSK
ncbi:MAG: nucleotide exchange factor GrpE [Alphaproteobacteria bacterium]|nr:nucleotide exchange factor GrpE [Alphaproteobacteria bacterium]MBR5130899.1 nucleotide exchange factor GrpE [Alphaproteobacteria bacterium]